MYKEKDWLLVVPCEYVCVNICNTCVGFVDLVWFKLGTIFVLISYKYLFNLLYNIQIVERKRRN